MIMMRTMMMMKITASSTVLRQRVALAVLRQRVACSVYLLHLA